jgi:ubiquinol-cytochrome c reductase cytochrome c1 subunit
VNVREGLHYNPYFPGGAIAMPLQLMDGAIEYPDGTPGTASQYAKDCAEFLTWAAEPEHDERKKSGAKFVVLLSVLVVMAGYNKRFRWAPLKNRKVTYVR